MTRINRHSRLDRAFYKIDRERILIEQGGKCYYCKEYITRSEATMDHVVHLSKNGRYHSAANCVVACEECNTRRSDKEKPDFTDRPWWKNRLDEILNNLEKRTRLAEYNLSINRMGSFKKWEKHWTKQGRWV